MKNWKTTITGLVLGAYPFIQGLYDAYNNGFFKDKHTLVEILFGAAIIIGGLVSKDHDVTGKVLIPIVVCLGALGCNAQSSVGIFNDTTAYSNEVSFTGPTLLYATNFKQSSQSALITTVGIQYRSNQFKADWSAALQAGVGGTATPINVSSVYVVGITASIKRLGSITLPARVVVGFLYNLSSQRTMAAYGGGLPLGLQ